MESDTRRQLSALFGSIDDGLHFLVCSKRDFSGRWFDDVDAGAAFAATEAASSDVYVGVGVRRTLPGPNQRGLADEIDGIPGLWVDVDVGGTAHAKKQLPTTLAEARALVESIFPMFPPSMLVFSGHGLQAWWLFPEPWIFADAAERRKAQGILERFGSTVRSAARARKFVVDGVFELARVFRLAGTWNRKTDPPIATRLEVPEPGASVRRYELDDLEACFSLDEAEDGAGRGIDVAPLLLSHNRLPPADALLALLVNDEKAKASWERKRADFGDQSASSYDFSLAIFAARHGWTDQEIADLLIAWRVKHGEPLKESKRGIIRLDYYQRTIRAARAAVADERDDTAYEDENETPLVAGGKPIDDKARVKIMQKARGVFALPIVKFIQNGEEDDARFSFVLADGRTVMLGGGADLEDQKRIRGRIYPVMRRFPRTLKPKAWARLWEELGAVAEIVVNEETGREGRFAALLFEYLSDKTGAVTSALRSAGEWRASVPTGDPFVRDGQLFVCTTSIEAYARAVHPRKVEPRDLWGVLAEWGFKNQPVKVRLGGQEIARRYWAVPIDDLGDRKGFTVPLVYRVGVDPLGPGGTGGAPTTASTPAGRVGATATPKSGPVPPPMDDFGGLPV